MRIKEGFVVREVGGSVVAVPTGEATKDFRGMIRLNDTAVFLWKVFLTDATREEAIAALEGEYNVSRAEAEEGVDAFVSTLIGNDLIE